MVSALPGLVVAALCGVATDEPPPRLTFSVAPGVAGRMAPSPGVSGVALSLDVSGLWALNRWLSIGPTVGTLLQPWTTTIADCPGGCSSPDGAYETRAGPAVRFTAPWQRFRVWGQVSAQYEYQFVTYPAGPTPRPWQGRSSFLAGTDACAEVAITKHLWLGARVAAYAGPQELTLGLAGVLSILR